MSFILDQIHQEISATLGWQTAETKWNITTKTFNESLGIVEHVNFQQDLGFSDNFILDSVTDFATNNLAQIGYIHTNDNKFKEETHSDFTEDS
tara:strand:+ start:2549 stop:2827 length:279 start_codon:yes stop_codon:yes gene_type:complete